MDELSKGIIDLRAEMTMQRMVLSELTCMLLAECDDPTQEAKDLFGHVSARLDQASNTTAMKEGDVFLATVHAKLGQFFSVVEQALRDLEDEQ
jgi:hypothetical protein